jgi:WD40 repeat protein
MNKRYLAFVFLLLIGRAVAQLSDIKIIIPKEIGYSQNDFLQFFPDEKYFITCGNALTVFNTETCELVDEYDLLFGAKNLSMSPDGKYILVSVNTNLMIFTFENQKLNLYAKLSTSELLQGIPETDYYKQMPLGAAFFINKGNEIYACIAHFTFIYDVGKKMLVNSYTLPLGSNMFTAVYNKKKNEVIGSFLQGEDGGIVRQSLTDLSKQERILKNKTIVYKMKLCDSLLLCFDTDKYFILNIETGKIVEEITMPLSTALGMDKTQLASVNKRNPIGTPDHENFKPEEYVLDMDFERSQGTAVFVTSKELKFLDLKTKKITKRAKGIFTNIRISPSGNRMVANGYLFYKALRVYSPKTFTLVAERNTMGNPIYSANISPDKRWLYTNGSNSGFIWNLANFTKHVEIKDISGKDSSFIMSVQFLNDSEVIVNSGTSLNSLNLFLYNFLKKEVVKVIKKEVYSIASGFMNKEFYYADYSHLYIVNLVTKKEEMYEGTFSMAAIPSYKIITFTDKLVFIPGSGKFSVIDRKTKKKVYESDSWAMTNKVLFSEDGNYLFTNAQVNRKQKINGTEFESPVHAIVRIDLQSRKMNEGYASSFFPYDFRLRDNGKTIGMWYVKYDLSNYNPNENEVMYTEYDVESCVEKYSKTADKTPTIMPFYFASDSGKYFALADAYTAYFKVFDNKGNELIDLKSMNICNPRCFFIEDKDLLIVTSPFNTMALFVDLKQKKVIGQLANAEGDQYFLISSDLHYLGSKEFVKNIRFKHNNEMYGFEQFDAYLNQPHQVLRAFSCSDSALIQAYEKAYTKRLKLLGIKPGTKVNFAALPNFQQIKIGEDKNGLVNFSVSANKGAAKLQLLKVYNNGNLVLSETIPADKSDRYEKNLSFETSSGINRFEFVAVDEQGLESPHLTRFYNNTSQVKPNLYIAVIASEKFANPDFNLAYAVKDANDMANTMANSKAFNKVVVKKVFNKSFNTDSIPELKKFFAAAGVNDVIMIFFAGHGFLDTDFSYYFPTYYTDFNDPKINSVSYNTFEKLLKDVKPLRKLMFIDACFSGEVDVDETYFDKGEDNHDKDSSRSVRSAAFAQSTALEMSKTVFSDLRQSSGATVISSAGGTEAAFEGEKWNNGLFTHCVLDGLTNLKADYNLDEKISLTELQKFVADEVYKLSEGKQMPTYRLENTVLDYELW